ncbi:hypothetical protein SAMN05216509_0701 [Pseudomonas sp. B10]|jgi:uncharacterized protein YdcH (DUF465 family)|uniref:DUF465 domain-containing protein n=2 Tax=Pseudomonas TaxID=286 RepID=A0A5E7JN03_PSEFL|nr:MULTISPECIES: DUF465 domain-containing protein [Pseudomonas]AMT88751.1 hypothetical protein AYO71_14805 [Pseudomonas koreensis]KQT67783.1 hypothetical protein ASG55_07850 [Pseudomonas sp. Leaf434]MBB4055275.1 hypothetical protein [Pseudomonas koreensis]MBV4469246.1 DUF465 domain-containing protein [Pseudomonas siliginis]MCP1475965.1 uncharacterized protein YdcH (DUF465 family) [Pseudomonas koreensis]
MPVSHDLYQDLGCKKEEIEQKRSEDPKLDSLLNKYFDVDKAVVEAENAQSDAPTDDELKKLKEKRVIVKEQIVAQLAGQPLTGQ